MLIHHILVDPLNVILNLVAGGLEADDFGHGHFADFEDADQSCVDDGVEHDGQLHHDHRPHQNLHRTVTVFFSI